MKAYSVLEMRSQRLIAVGLVAVLLLAFVGLPQAFAETSGSGAYEDISVDAAYNMIKEAQTGIVVLDVRNQSEYNLGHLYGAVLIPVYELEDRISELQEHINDPIIVYCKAGSRSQIASQVLVDHGFTKVYNMLGGIIAWMEAGYPIYTTYHYVKVDATSGRTLIQVDPLLMHIPDSAPNGCGCSCKCGDSYTSCNASIVEIAQNENTMMIKLLINGEELKITVTTIEITNETFVGKHENETLLFTYTRVSNSLGFSASYYTLTYIVETTWYYFGTQTYITPLKNNDGYNYSFTHVSFAPKDGKNVKTMEFVNITGSLKLSQLYNTLSDAIRKLKKLYNDQGINDIANNYNEIEKNLNKLSKVTNKQLREYDNIVLENTAIIEDDRIAVCIFPFTALGVGYSIVFYCLDPKAPTWVIVGACCAALYAVVVGVAAACVATAMVACLLAIVAGILSSWASLSGCWGYCPSMQVCFALTILWWSFDLVCIQAW